MDAQMIGAAVQATATIALVVITWRYVTFTRHLFQLQVEPRLDFEIPRDYLVNRDAVAYVVNKSGCDVEDVQLIASLPGPEVEGGGRIFKCIESKHIATKLKPKGRTKIDATFILEAALGQGNSAKKGQVDNSPSPIVLLGLSFRRAVDGRDFAFEEPYVILHDEDGTLAVGRAGQRQKQDNLDRQILREVKS